MSEKDPKLQITSFKLDDGVLKEPERHPYNEATTQRQAEQLQRDLLEKIPSQEEGLAPGRVENFFRVVLKLDIGAYTFVTSDNLDKLNDALSDTHHGGMEENSGIALHRLNTAVVLRQPEMELHNGAEYSEIVLAHELAHLTGKTMVTHFEHEEGSFKRDTRTGFSVEKEDPTKDGEIVILGDLYEEGFAQYVAMEYSRVMLRKPNAYQEGETFQWGHPDEDPLFDEMDAKYLIYNKDGSWTLSVSSIATATIELLDQYDPRIVPLMISARKDFGVWKEFIKIVNEIEPGLYQTLLHVPLDGDAFSEAYMYVKQLIKSKNKGSAKA
jgi:hypothetical protein